MEPDAQIVAAVLDGRPEAFGTLVRRYERAVLSAAVYVLGDLHAAEDAAQDAFVKAYENLRSLRDRAAFGAWLLKIVRRQALTMAQKRVATTAADPVEDDFPEGSKDSLDERSTAILDAVMRLPEHERRAVMLHYFDGHSVRDIADITGLAVGTVTKQLSRGRERLRKLLEATEQ